MEQNQDRDALPSAEKAHSLTEMAAQARRDGQDQLACNYYVQSLSLYRGLEDRTNIVRILIRLGYLSGWADFGDGLDMFSRHQKLGEEAIPIARQIGTKRFLQKRSVHSPQGCRPANRSP